MTIYLITEMLRKVMSPIGLSITAIVNGLEERDYNFDEGWKKNA